MHGTDRIAGAADFPALSVDGLRRVVVLTGAGISAESGVSTFRDAGGLWRTHRLEDLATPQAWRRNPELVWRFYSERRRQMSSVAPNAAHVALADLERRLGDALVLCTQNVDCLHERGGSQRVIHMHGELLKSRCERDHAEPFEDEALYFELDAIPRCACGGRIRPHICWFGEVPFELPALERFLGECDLFVTIGSSGAVYPAASFAEQARAAGAKTVYVGPEAPENVVYFDECRLGTAAEVVPRLFAV